jgi:hypothetical protein
LTGGGGGGVLKVKVWWKGGGGDRGGGRILKRCLKVPPLQGGMDLKEVDRRGDGKSNFTVKKARISVQLYLHLDSLRTRVVSLEAWILQIMVM